GRGARVLAVRQPDPAGHDPGHGFRGHLIDSDGNRCRGIALYRSSSNAIARSPAPIANVQPSIPWPTLNATFPRSRRMLGADSAVIGRGPAHTLSTAS